MKPQTVFAQEGELNNLYAQSAVLMDADSGRILFSKNGQQERAMASTTKIMTCILALEYGKLDDIVTASANAAGQPKVRLGVTQGETFYMRDLLYSLMLESHNDVAVAVAEHIGKNVEGFADMMNAKAKEIGCEQTYFITPNGLDAADEINSHHTTAEELAKIMKYCIMESPQREMFLEITRTASYQFSDCEGKRSFSCSNHNAFLQMMDGALTGKTGFTGDAGYCYVGALQRDGRTFIVALLACGWPNNKSYKWSDTKALMNYALENYQYQKIWETPPLENMQIEDGINKKDPYQNKTEIKLEISDPDLEWQMLLKEGENIEIKCDIEKTRKAPVEKGQKVGNITYLLNGEPLRSFDVITNEAVEEKTLKWYAQTVLKMFTLKNINESD